jgi:diaminopimelate decarboxylase
VDYFRYVRGELCCEQVPARVLAERFGTPLYVYSARTLREHVQSFRRAFAALKPLICFSVKACQNIHILRYLRELGCGFDVVSGGELYRALRAGADPAAIVFAGAGKSERELREALAAGIGLFNVESEHELEQLCRLAGDCEAPVRAALRINPNVAVSAHAYTVTGKSRTKFGVDWRQAVGIFQRHRPTGRVALCGIHLHLGSPVADIRAYERAIRRALSIMERLRRQGFKLDTLDIGGGYAGSYGDAPVPEPQDYGASITPLLIGRGLRIILEPGRAIAANAGILLTRVLHTKECAGRRFVVVDASMNELIRPALYGAYHFIWPVRAGGQVPQGRGPEQPHAGLWCCDVVGPVCESGDFLAQKRWLPPTASGDLLAVFSAGAYAMSMASQYNSRPRAAEVLVEGCAVWQIRRRETYADLVAPERVRLRPSAMVRVRRRRGRPAESRDGRAAGK